MNASDQQSKEDAFQRLTKEIDQITEHTRNEIVRYYGIHFLAPGSKPGQPSTVLQDLRAEQGIVQEYLTAQGFQKSGNEPLQPLSQDDARLVLRKSLVNSVTYDDNQDTDDKQAHKLTDEFFDMLVEPKNTLYFAIESYCLQDNFFESGLIAIDDEKVMYVWFEETD